MTHAHSHYVSEILRADEVCSSFDAFWAGFLNATMRRPREAGDTHQGPKVFSRLPCSAIDFVLKDPPKNTSDKMKYSSLAVRHPLCFALLFACLILAPISRAYAADQWTLTDSQFRSSPFTIDSIDSQGIHSTSSTASWENILELSRSTAAPSASAKFDLYLTTGDRFIGEPIALTNEQLQWKSPLLGQIDSPSDRLAAIVPHGTQPPRLDESRTDDVIHLINGDSTHGIITQIGPSGVTLQAGDATPTLAWETISAVLFSSSQHAPSFGHAFRVRLADDETITATDLSLSNDRLTLTLAPQSSRAIDASAISSIEQLDGPISWLTSHAPAADIYKPFFSEQFPTRFEHTVDGRPLRDVFPAFHHGIGCHSYSKLVYNLDGQYAAFRTQFAIDSDSPLADVTVRILLDDKVVYEQKNVRAGVPWPVVTIPLGQSRTLALEVDYGLNYATADRFVWLDPAFVRTPPSTNPSTAPSF
jgi:hypothetical protein